MITVAIVDDDGIVCDILSTRLDDEPDFECVGVAGTAEEARNLAMKHKPEIILLDIMLGGTTDPIDLAAELVALSTTSQVVVCTAWSDNVTLDREEEFRQKVRASRNGVTDWISKSRGVNEVIQHLREAALRPRGPINPPTPIEDALNRYLRTSESIFDGMRFRGNVSALTPAEVRIAAVVARGLEADMTVDEICKVTRMTPGTVRGHLKSIYGKWNVHLQAAFVAEARRRGLLGD